jgi:hypothetical protein
MEPLENPITLRNTIHSLRASLTAATDRIAALESAPSATGVLPDNVERWVKYTTMFNAPQLLADDSLSATAGFPMVEVASIPADSVATGLRFVVPTFFTGGPITDVLVNLSSLIVGGSSVTSSFTSGSSLFTIYSATAPANLAKNGLIVAGSAPTPIEFEFMFTNGYGSDLVEGQLDTYIRLSIPQSTGTTLPTA